MLRELYVWSNGKKVEVVVANRGAFVHELNYVKDDVVLMFEEDPIFIKK